MTYTAGGRAVAASSSIRASRTSTQRGEIGATAIRDGRSIGPDPSNLPGPPFLALELVID
jgi:hypothetical protein